MSHLSCATPVVEDIDALEEAFKKLTPPKEWERAYPKLKLTFKRDQKTFRWYGSSTSQCDHAIVADFGEGNKYEIGVVARKDGGWNLQYDSCLRPMTGMDGERVISLYAEEIYRKHAAETGMTMETEELADGNLKIVLSEAGNPAKKLIGTIDRKTGKNTLTCEGGDGGGACLTDTSLLEQKLGMREPEREMLPQFYQKNDQDLSQEVGGA